MSTATFADVARWRKQVQRCATCVLGLRECLAPSEITDLAQSAYDHAASELRRAEHAHRAALDAEAREADGPVIRAALARLSDDEAVASDWGAVASRMRDGVI
jgi:hypothetical protein